MTSGLLKIFSSSGKPPTLIEYLDSCSYDELVELDLVNDRCRNIFHVEGKYFVPITDGSYHVLYDYTVNNAIHPDDRDIFAQFLDPDTVSERLSTSEVPGALSARYRYRLQDGGWRWTEQFLVGDGRQGLPEGIIRQYIFDADNLVKRELGEQVTHLSVSAEGNDELTGLIGEKAFLASIGNIACAAPALPWCLISIDLDHFKLFNERNGREEGDFLLAEIGARLSEETEETEGLACYRGQDDFCLFVPYEENRVKRLFDDASALVASHGLAAGFLPAFGIAPYNESAYPLELLDQADIASNSAKDNFRERICMFKQPMREQEEREYRVLSDFLYGLENEEIFFQLQPQCLMSTGKIVGAEALARWRKADQTMVSPADFVPALEHHGFITSLDCHIWEEVCMWLRTWIDSGHEPVPVSVNVSQVDFYTIDVPEHFEKLVTQYELDTSLIKIEVTESAYVNDMDVIDTATRLLHEKGFLVLMDDFGSGYSSLNTLRNLAVDAIKLDAQFLQIGKDENHKGVRILESVISMAKSLNLPIICEGVETEEQTSFLEHQGCRYVQGFKFYRPMDVQAFEEIIEHDEMVDLRGFVAEITELQDEMRLSSTEQSFDCTA